MHLFSPYCISQFLEGKIHIVFPSLSVRGKVSFRHLVLNTALHQTFLHLNGRGYPTFQWETLPPWGPAKELNKEGWSVACVRLKQQVFLELMKVGKCHMDVVMTNIPMDCDMFFCIDLNHKLSCTHEPNYVLSENKVDSFIYHTWFPFCSHLASIILSMFNPQTAVAG